jgi:type 2 lantibiotic biosynthesis protein LanM
MVVLETDAPETVVLVTDALVTDALETDAPEMVVLETDVREMVVLETDAPETVVLETVVIRTIVGRKRFLRLVDAWLKGQRLSERIEAIRQKRVEDSTFDAKKAKTKLASWKKTAGFADNSDRFKRRLRLASCSSIEFLNVLGTPPESLFASDWKPHWQSDFLKSEEYPQAFPSTVLNEFEDRGIVNIFLPLIRFNAQKLAAGIENTPSSGGTKQNAADCVDLFLKPFLQSFEYNIRRAVVLEINSLRVLGKLEGETESERFLDFVRKTKLQSYRLHFFEKYPVLARYAHIALGQWVRSNVEFMNFLAKDREEIQSVFGINSAESLESFHPSGDTHNGGRSVATVVFQSGKKLLYKPRNLEIDECFQDFLDWCNSRGLKLKHKTMKIIAYEDHGWVEFIEKINAQNDQEYLDFYHRLGSLLAILYSLKTVDVFFENLMAFGDSPVVVDLETLFHPRLDSEPIKSASDLAIRTIQNSVMSVGILPQPTLSDNGKKTFDISGIGASVDQQAPYNVSGIINFGRDDIQISKIPGWIPSAHNRPDDDENRPIPAERILDGFSETYDLLQENREVLLSQDGPLNGFKKCRSRLIARNTIRYGDLLTDSFHPDLLRDDLDRAWHWDNLWSDANHRPVVERFIESELRQIDSYDIPHFTVGVDGNDIEGADGTEVVADGIASGWSLAAARIESLSESDKQKQSWFIRASLGETRNLVMKPLLPGVEDDLLEGACQIGDAVLGDLIKYEGSSSFLKVASVMGENRSSGNAFSISNADCGIYEGTGGVVLFLAYLGQESRQEKYTIAARSLLANIKETVRGENKGQGISGFLGYGSLVYLYAHLSSLWNEESLIHEAEELIDSIYPIIEEDPSLDVLTGAAGCILSILPLIAINPFSKAKRCAIKCAKYLMEKQDDGEPRWTGLEFKRGFSHGFSGVATALHELGIVTKRKIFIAEALRIVAHENSLLGNDKWTDLHQLNGRDQVSWCHGAPGIALGRLSMYKTDKSASLRDDITRSLNETSNHYWMSSHCLCHGTLGNLEPLLIARKYPEFEALTECVNEHLAVILKVLIKDGWCSLLPSQTLSLGLMTGISGIGYSLLRFHTDGKIPSVLMLESPTETPDFHRSLRKHHILKTLSGWRAWT